MPRKRRDAFEIPEAHNEEEQRSRGDDTGEQLRDPPPQPRKSEDNPWLKWKDNRKV